MFRLTDPIHLEDYNLMFDNLTSAQKRCTELIEENRLLRSVCHLEQNPIGAHMKMAAPYEKRIRELEGQVEALRVALKKALQERDKCRNADTLLANLVNDARAVGY